MTATRRLHRPLLLAALCAGALGLAGAGLAADSDYNSRSTSSGSSTTSGSSSNVGSDSSTTGNTGSAAGGSGTGAGTSGTSSSSTDTGVSNDTDRGSNRSSSGGAGTYIRDSVITAKVKAALARDKEVTARNIRVETDAQGVVTLSGEARTQTEADRAATIARTIDGVTSVTNNIRVP